MKFRTYDLNGRKHSSNSFAQIEELLKSQEANGFYISELKGSNPYLLVSTNGNTAVMFFFPEDENHPGFVSRNHEQIIGLDLSESTEFLLTDSSASEKVDNGSVVTISYAIETSKYFLENGIIDDLDKWIEF